MYSVDILIVYMISTSTTYIEKSHKYNLERFKILQNSVIINNVIRNCSLSTQSYGYITLPYTLTTSQ